MRSRCGKALQYKTGGRLHIAPAATSQEPSGYVRVAGFGSMPHRADRHRLQPHASLRADPEMAPAVVSGRCADSCDGINPGSHSPFLRDKKMRFPPNHKKGFLRDVFRGGSIGPLPHHHRLNARAVKPEEVLESLRIAMERNPLEKIVHAELMTKAGCRDK